VGTARRYRRPVAARHPALVDSPCDGQHGSELSIASAGSILSMASAGSILSIGSAGSILSIGSAGSILSIGSAGSILSVGSAFSALSVGSFGSILSTGRAFHVGGQGARRAGTALAVAALASLAIDLGRTVRA
jgi:hypothetical protein